MYRLEATGRFKKDLKTAKKRNLNINLIKTAIRTLEKNGALPPNLSPILSKAITKDIMNVTFSQIGL